MPPICSLVSSPERFTTLGVGFRVLPTYSRPMSPEFETAIALNRAGSKRSFDLRPRYMPWGVDLQATWPST
jgi:hypothetical protein